MYSRIRLRAALMALFACALPLSIQITIFAQNTYPPSTPFLRIETGTHTAKVKSIEVDAAERFLVTASEDKTARVWDLTTGKLLQTLRPPQGDGFEGVLYAVAISPDGGTVAVGGYTGPPGGPFAVYFFDRSTGTLIRELGGFPEVIDNLSYSKNGFYLAVALGRGGIRVYRTSDYKEIARDASYESNSYWAEFDSAGRLVTSSADGYLRLYDSKFQLLTKKQAPGGKQPFFVRFSPDGGKVAVSFFDSSAVNVLSGADLSFLYSPDTRQAADGEVGPVAWSVDGKILYAGGRFGLSRQCPIMSWGNGGRGSFTVWPEAGTTLLGLLALTRARAALGTGDGVVGVIDANGRPVWEHMPAILGYPGSQDFRVSDDGSVVQFDGYTFKSEGGWSHSIVQYSVADRQLSLNPDANPSLKSPRRDGLNVTDWKDSHEPKLNGSALAVRQYDLSRSLAISTTDDKFLLGTEWHLRLFDRQGRRLWEVEAPGAAFAVNLTADSRYAIAGFGDGTVRWYRVDNGQEVMGLFVHPDGQRWIAWTPEGFFDASPGGDALVGYHLNRGPDHEGEFVKAEQVVKLFYRPDLISQVLKPGGVKILTAERSRIGDISTVLSAGLPPDLDLLSPAQTDSEGSYVLQFRVNKRNGGMGRVVYRIDGVEIEGRPVDIPTPGVDTLSRKFDLPLGQHRISVTAYNGSNRVESRSITALVNVKGAQQAPALFVVAVGISKYRDYALNQGVKFAAQDAQLVASRLKQQGGGLFREVVPYPVTDENATRANIEKTIADVSSRIQPNDEFVLYLAGHGTAVEGEYYFVPWEIRYTSEDALRKQSLGEEEIQKLLKTIQAKKTLLVLDTCSAGTALSGRALGEKASIDRLSKITGRAILAASSSEQMALEGYQNHGVFTAALLEGLSKAADERGLIEVSRLADYVEDRVPEITKQRWGYEQFPMSELAGQTFPIARKQ
ncbi:MAG: caspase family protein [Acidobacteriaceae bacterium]|nr:caspase family protein [Acidobacteriaceae bacterium]MBV9295233.1 caspase family protein [Acidobacteriaceae bacterium]